MNVILPYEPISHYTRIVVVGPTGCGKTTLSTKLSEIMGLPHIELDALHWGANWTPIPSNEFLGLVAYALAGETWIADGNFDYARNVIWKRTQLVIWLDYHYSIVLWRVVKRTLMRFITQEKLWNGNIVTWKQVFSKKSVVADALLTYQGRKDAMLAALASQEYASIKYMHFRKPLEADQWLSSLLD